MPSTANRVVLELIVNNHPGVMSHVCGLFARRAFNVEAILVLPLGGGETSRIQLLVNADQRLDQMVKQAEKLRDVHEVALCDAASSPFEELGKEYAAA